MRTRNRLTQQEVKELVCAQAFIQQGNYQGASDMIQHVLFTAAPIIHTVNPDGTSSDFHRTPPGYQGEKETE